MKQITVRAQTYFFKYYHKIDETAHSLSLKD